MTDLTLLADSIASLLSVYEQKRMAFDAVPKGEPVSHDLMKEIDAAKGRLQSTLHEVAPQIIAALRSSAAFIEYFDATESKLELESLPGPREDWTSRYERLEAARRAAREARSSIAAGGTP